MFIITSIWPVSSGSWKTLICLHSFKYFYIEFTIQNVWAHSTRVAIHTDNRPIFFSKHSLESFFKKIFLLPFVEWQRKSWAPVKVLQRWRSHIKNICFEHPQTVADPGSPRGGVPTLGGEGANIRFCQIFPKTAWNWKNLDPRGEGGGGTRVQNFTM